MTCIKKIRTVKKYLNLNQNELIFWTVLSKSYKLSFIHNVKMIFWYFLPCVESHSFRVFWLLFLLQILTISCPQGHLCPNTYLLYFTWIIYFVHFARVNNISLYNLHSYCIQKVPSYVLYGSKSYCKIYCLCKSNMCAFVCSSDCIYSYYIPISYNFRSSAIY